MLTFDKLCMGCMNDNGGEDICPICGYTKGTPNPEGTLPVKTRINGRYVIGKMLETNGEGITYIGWDCDENNIVNVREFFPVPLSVRNDDCSVGINEGNEYYFNAALLDFIDLGKKLKDVNLNAVFPIADIIECNSTAYIITKVTPGISLREFLLRNGGTLSWEQARPLFMPLISTIISLHKAGIIHGGISPETIMVGRDGKLRLTGFSIHQFRKSKSPINAQIFPGYAAIEQYGTEDTDVISEATDVYGFASTLFRVLMGSTLPEASERITDDKMSIPAKIAEELPKPVLISLANALQILFENRTKTMEDFKIDIAPAADSTSGFVAVKTDGEKDKKVVAVGTKATEKKPTSAKKYAFIAAAITAGIFLLIALICLLLFGDLFKNDNNDGTTSQPTSSVMSPVESSSVPVNQNNSDLIELPDFTSGDLTIDDVRNQNPELNFTVVGKKYHSKAAGYVVAQDIAGGTMVKKGSTIKLTISLGSENLKIPDLNGLSKDEAMLVLYKNGFLYHNITFYEKASDEQANGCVFETAPAMGEVVTPEDKIDIFLAKNSSSNTSEPSNEAQ